MTIENFGFGDFASAVKNPDFSQNPYHFASTGFGSYREGKSSVFASGMSGYYRGERAAVKTEFRQCDLALLQLS
jgi:hypothetical protein